MKSPDQAGFIRFRTVLAWYSLCGVDMAGHPLGPFRSWGGHITPDSGLTMTTDRVFVEEAPPETARSPFVSAFSPTTNFSPRDGAYLQPMLLRGLAIGHMLLKWVPGVFGAIHGG